MPHHHRTIALALCMLGIASWVFYPGGRSSARPQESLSIAGADRDILNETLGARFQKIFVINLPSRSDRRDAMTLAGALTGLRFDWTEGVPGDQVMEKALPLDSLDKNISKGNIGSWRAHMNALRTIIQQNLTTALILEDDIDWDIRLKSQLQNLSLATRGHLQPLSSDPTTTLRALSLSPAQPNPPTILTLPSLPPTLQAATSPYGSNWDVLWLGHCGTDFPSPPLPPLRIEIRPDATVPSSAHGLRPHPFAEPDSALAASHPPHTRVVHAAGAATSCTQGYAVSARGAARLLWRFGTTTFTAGWDLMLRDWCAGAYDRERREEPVCLAVRPPLFAQHYGWGGASDIAAPGGGFIDRGREMTPYVRLSVRLNMGALVRGDGVGELVDQWPD